MDRLLLYGVTLIVRKLVILVWHLLQRKICFENWKILVILPGFPSLLLVSLYWVVYNASISVADLSSHVICYSNLPLCWCGINRVWCFVFQSQVCVISLIYLFLWFLNVKQYSINPAFLLGLHSFWIFVIVRESDVKFKTICLMQLRIFFFNPSYVLLSCLKFSFNLVMPLFLVSPKKKRFVSFKNNLVQYKWKNIIQILLF